MLVGSEDAADDTAALGIPEPRLLSDADGGWRSRLSGERWEVNDAHADYRELRGDARARLRDLLALLAKEIVLRTAGRPDLQAPLESLVEILAHAERNLRGESPRLRRARAAPSGSRRGRRAPG